MKNHSHRAPKPVKKRATKRATTAGLLAGALFISGGVAAAVTGTPPLQRPDFSASPTADTNPGGMNARTAPGAFPDGTLAFPHTLFTMNPDGTINTATPSATPSMGSTPGSPVTLIPGLTLGPRSSTSPGTTLVTLPDGTVIRTPSPGTSGSTGSTSSPSTPSATPSTGGGGSSTSPTTPSTPKPTTPAPAPTTPAPPAPTTPAPPPPPPAPASFTVAQAQARAGVGNEDVSGKCSKNSSVTADGGYNWERLRATYSGAKFRFSQASSTMVRADVYYCIG